MTGMQTLVALRQQGMKPSAVFVDLVKTIGKYEAERFSFAEGSGVLSIHIAEADSLADIDFRPLVGLQVFVSEFADDKARHVAACKAIDKAGASHMVTPFWNGEDLTVHQRHADGTTERFSA